MSKSVENAVTDQVVLGARTVNKFTAQEVGEAGAYKLVTGVSESYED